MANPSPNREVPLRFLHVTEVELTRERATSDLTDVIRAREMIAK